MGGGGGGCETGWESWSRRTDVGRDGGGGCSR